MKKKIEKYKYIKELDSSFEVNIPEETIYLFQYHVRRSIRVKPIYTTFNKEVHGKDEEIYELEITVVYGNFENKIEKLGISISSIQNQYLVEKGETFSLLDFILTGISPENIRTKEEFDADFEKVLANIKE